MDNKTELISKHSTQFDSICSKMKKLLAKKQSLNSAEPKCIYPRLFVSNYSYAINKNFIQSSNITFIISCVKISEKDKIQNVNYEEILVRDKPDEPIEEHFGRVFQMLNSHFIRTPNECAMINCFSGISRSVTLALSFIMKKMNNDFSQAYEIVLKEHPSAKPNEGFAAKLKQYAQQIVEDYENLDDSIQKVIFYEEKSSDVSKQSPEPEEIVCEKQQAEMKQIMISSQQSSKNEELKTQNETFQPTETEEKKEEENNSDSSKKEEDSEKMDQKTQDKEAEQAEQTEQTEQMEEKTVRTKKNKKKKKRR